MSSSICAPAKTQPTCSKTATIARLNVRRVADADMVISVSSSSISRMRRAPAMPGCTSEGENGDKGRKAQNAHQTHVSDELPDVDPPCCTSHNPCAKAAVSAKP